MTNPLLSVIIPSTIGNANTLKITLNALKEQKTTIPFEVLVINDGFDEHISTIVRIYQKYLNLRFFPRENDKCVSRSRNIGAKEAQAKYLVFIDSDVVLNPMALNNYYIFLTARKNICIWGEYTSDKVADRRAGFFNKKFEEYINSERNIILLFKPYSYAYSGNFGIEKELFFKVGAFNEIFVGYGLEDVEFGYRLYKNKVYFSFSREVGANHIHNTRKSSFYSDEHNNEAIFHEIIKDDIEKYFSLDEKIILQEFEYLKSILGNKIWGMYIIYYLTKKNEKKAIEYTEIAKKYLPENGIKFIWSQYYKRKSEYFKTENSLFLL